MEMDCGLIVLIDMSFFFFFECVVAEEEEKCGCKFFVKVVVVQGCPRMW